MTKQMAELKKLLLETVYCDSQDYGELVFITNSTHEALVDLGNWIGDLQAEREKLKGELRIHRWIPVSERLPKQWTESNYRSESVLVTDGTDVWVTCYQNNLSKWMSGRYSPNPDGITHWKPVVLPKQVLKGGE